MKKVRLNLGNNIQSEFQRMINIEVNFIRDCLENEKLDPNEKIHETRKSFKFIRAILRMYRKSMNENIYKRENIFYRDLA